VKRRAKTIKTVKTDESNENGENDKSGKHKVLEALHSKTSFSHSSPQLEKNFFFNLHRMGFLQSKERDAHLHYLKIENGAKNV